MMKNLWKVFDRASKSGVLALTIFLTAAAYAGGPRYVAGTSYFDPAVAGKPIVWANGLLSYYTDLGDLSATVSQAQANSMIAAAAAVWNAVPTAAVSISAGGNLSEDVSGANVSSSGNTLTLPADIQSGDTAKPIAIVFDEDGSIINASAANTISVTGTIRFRNGQGMQGVNVVLRPLIPGTTLPDVRYTVTAVSGTYFRGNAENPVTGSTDAHGNALGRFGSGDTAVEGYYDLSGVPVPPGYATDAWELSLEPIDPLYTGSESVGPYTTGQVTPSGTLPTVAIPGLAAGVKVIQNVTIGNSAGNSLSGDDGMISAPVTVPPTGEWTARLAGYGHTSWLQWWAKANREFTVEAYALDDKGEPTLNKAQIVLGMWNGTDPISNSPVTYTSQPFNGAVAGLTTLPVLTLADSEVRLGISDLRGDGRPDYLYRGRVLYADTVRPSILPAGGGPIAITGMGFRPNSVVSVNGVPATVTSVSPTEITAIAPPSAGTTGTVPLQVKDPQTLAVAVIADGVSYGAQNDDTIGILTAPSGTVAPGSPLPFTVTVNSGTSPAAGATVTYAIAQGNATLACGQPSCSVVTAANGTATLAVAANSTTPTAVTATLANGASVSTQFTANTGAAAAISPLTPDLYLAAGAIAEWTPQGLVLKNGTPTADAVVTWTPAATGVTAPTTASLSGSNGIVTQQLSVGPLASGVVVPVNACLSTGTSCAQFDVVSVAPATAQLQPIANISQMVATGQSFNPVMLQVTDPAGHPLAGAIVTFYETLDAWTQPCSAEAICPPAPLLQQETVQATSGSNGMVVLNPIGSSGRAVRLYVTAVTGNSALLNFELEQHP